MRRPINLIMS